MSRQAACRRRARVPWRVWHGTASPWSILPHNRLLRAPQRKHRPAAMLPWYAPARTGGKLDSFQGKLGLVSLSLAGHFLIIFVCFEYGYIIMILYNKIFNDIRLGMPRLNEIQIILILINTLNTHYIFLLGKVGFLINVS